MYTTIGCVSHRDPDHFLEESRQRQRNVVFPDTVRNARSVDAFLWKGSPDPTLVQRVAAWLWGLTFIGLGACLTTFVGSLRSDGEWAGAIIARSRYRGIADQQTGEVPEAMEARWPMYAVR